MTKDKDFKRLVRKRMVEAGGRYTTARQHLERSVAPASSRMARFAFAGMEKARLLGHHRAGEEHLLLALLDAWPDSRARQALAAAGITYDNAVAGLAAQFDREGPPVPHRYSGTLTAPSHHDVVGRAEGFAVGLGYSTPNAEHGLLALLWQVGGRVDRLIRSLGTTPEAVLAALVTEGTGVAARLPAQVIANPLLAAAEHQALRLGHHFIGEDHLVLALLEGDPDDLARRALEACGINHGDWAGHFRAKCEGGYPPPAPNPDITEARPNPVARQLLARAEGLAVAMAEPLPRSQHGLLALLWSPRGVAAASLKTHETNPAAVLAALRAVGAPVPSPQLPEPERLPLLGPRVFFPREHLNRVLAQLNDEVSPGSYGWNVHGERGWASATADVDLEAIIDLALADRR